MSDVETADLYADAVNADRLRKRIAAITDRTAKPIAVTRADGTVLLRGRRRTDRTKETSDRRSGNRRRSEPEA